MVSRGRLSPQGSQGTQKEHVPFRRSGQEVTPSLYEDPGGMASLPTLLPGTAPQVELLAYTILVSGV